MADQPLISANMIIGLLGTMLTGAIALVGYFTKNLHTRFEKHLEVNQEAHDEMRAAISAIREEAGRVEERQGAMKEQLSKVQLEVVALRADVVAIPERVVTLLHKASGRQQ